MTNPYIVANDVIENTAAITALVGLNYWPDERQEEDAFPCITYRDISEIRYDHLNAPGKGKQCRIQFDVWGITRTSTDAVADQLEIALSQSGRVVFAQATKDIDFDIYRKQFDWLVLIDNPS